MNSTKEFIDEISIYDLAGRKIYQRNNINDIDFSLLNLASNHQALVINIVLQNGHSVVRKVVY
ncbi:T9SS sorting signal type C domain-containing protein [Flavobacterium sp. 120]|uniref:T9SS sorting signal type C domain-containing protein n=1 Tax=Flavobacterium sp. 120 TaxID=2135626 RepID=UPI001314D66F